MPKQTNVIHSVTTFAQKTNIWNDEFFNQMNEALKKKLEKRCNN